MGQRIEVVIDGRRVSLTGSVRVWQEARNRTYKDRGNPYGGVRDGALVVVSYPEGVDGDVAPGDAVFSSATVQSPRGTITMGPGVLKYQPGGDVPSFALQERDVESD